MENQNSLNSQIKAFDSNLKQDKKIIDSINGFDKLLKTSQEKGVVAKVSLVTQLPTVMKNSQTMVDLFTKKKV